MTKALPRFRRDLEAHGLEEDGVHYVEVRDGRNNASFRFYDFEHAAALALDGRPLDQVLGGLRAQADLDLTVDQLAAFADELLSLGFLEPPQDPHGEPIVFPLAGGGLPRRELRDVETPMTVTLGVRASVPLIFGAVPDAAAVQPETKDVSPAPVIDPGNEGPFAPAVTPEPVTQDGDATVAVRPSDALLEALSDPIEAPIPDPGPVPTPGPVVAEPLLDQTAEAPPIRPSPVAVVIPASPVATPKRRPWILYAALGIMAAFGVGVLGFRMLGQAEPPAISVRTMTPSPTSVYRWFPGTAAVTAASAETLTLPTAGKIVEILAVGSKFAAGDVVVLLEAGRRARGEISRHRERLAFYQQMAESMKQAANRPELRQAEIKIEEKTKLVAEAQAELEKVALVARGSGEIAEAVVTEGATIKPGDPLVRLKGGGLMVLLPLSREDADRARKLGFCRIEIEGKPHDCSLAATGGDETHVALMLPPTPGAEGKSARMAMARLDAVFPIPATAIVRVADTDRVWIAAPTGRAEQRAVSVADRTDSDAYISQGLDVGDQVIIAPTPGLAAGVRVTAP